MSFFYVIALAAVVVVTFAVGQGTNDSALASTVKFFPAALALYFAPAGVAAVRQNPKAGAILVLNLLLGWTIVGWVGAMVWAYADGREPGMAVPEATAPQTRACPYCAEDVRAEAIRCRHCGSDLEPTLAA